MKTLRRSFPIMTAEGLNPDGLYRVTTSYLCAGFVIEGGKVTRCAPILKKKLSYWMRVAKRIERA